MELTEHLTVGDARLFVGQDMDKGALLDAGPGVAAVYSSRSPGKVSPNEDAAAFFSLGESDSVLAVADGLGGAQRLFVELSGSRQRERGDQDVTVGAEDSPEVLA